MRLEKKYIIYIDYAVFGMHLFRFYKNEERALKDIDVLEKIDLKRTKHPKGHSVFHLYSCRIRCPVIHPYAVLAGVKNRILIKTFEYNHKLTDYVEI